MGVWSRILLFFRIKTNAALDQAEDPRQVMDYAYSQQQDLLRKVKQGLVDVATSKRQLEYQASKLRARVPHLEDQARKALASGREDLARMALERKQTAAAELLGLDSQLADVADEERKLTLAEQQLSARVEEFRTRRQAASARYTAAEAQVRANEAIGGISDEFADLSMALGRAEEKTERMQARAQAIDALIDGGALELPGATDDAIDHHLRGVAADRELAALKAELARAQLPPPSADAGQSAPPPA